ncbi:MAG: SDR family NAD(P)-dependent oxidoreductase, partial [Sphingomonas sp.]
MKLQNNVAVITGAGSGIGREIALAFVREGARIAVCDIDLPAAEASVAEIEAAGGEALAIEMDVSDEAAVEAGVATAAAHFGRIDTMIANAGIQIVHPVEDFPYADFQKVVNVHLGGGFLLTKACIKVMYPQKSGVLIYMGSAHSHEASPLKSAYVAAKHGLLGLGRVMAKEGAPHGVRSNVICPGFVKTPLVARQIPE